MNAARTTAASLLVLTATDLLEDLLRVLAVGLGDLLELLVRRRMDPATLQMTHDSPDIEGVVIAEPLKGHPPESRGMGLQGKRLLDRGRAFEMPAPAEGESGFEYVQNREGDIEVFELVRVTPANVSQLEREERRALESQLVNQSGQRVDEYYQQSLLQNAEISRS